MGGFDTKNVIFTGLPKNNFDNAFTSFSDVINGAVKIKEDAEELKKRNLINDQIMNMRDLNMDTTKANNERNEQTFDISMMEKGDELADKEVSKQMINFKSLDELEKTYQFNSPQERTKAKAYYDGIQTEFNHNQAMEVYNSLPQNMTYSKFKEYIPKLIEDQGLNNKAIGQVEAMLYKRDAQALNIKVLENKLNPKPKERKTKITNVGDKQVLIDSQSGEIIREYDKSNSALEKQKMSQKYVQQVGAANAMGKVLTSLVDDYDSDYIGWADRGVHNASKYFYGADKNMAQYNQNLTKVKVIAKEFENMGATLSANEQALLEGTLPDPNATENVYKAQLTNYIKTIRDITKSKLDSSDFANYKTSALEKMLVPLDTAYQNSIKKFGENKKKKKVTLVAPKQKKIVATGYDKRAQKKVVRYDDGSVAYEN